MSNKQEGLISALQQTWPIAYSKPYERLMYANFISEYLGLALKRLFRKAYKSTNKNDFLIALDNIREINEAAKMWFNNLKYYFSEE